MKSVWRIQVVILILVCSGFAGFAQKNVTEAALTYDITLVSEDNADLAKSLQGAQLLIYFKGGHSRSDMISSLGTESNLYDAKAGKGFILKEYSGQKLMITLTRENWIQKNQMYHGLEFKIDKAEQVIEGYKCRKAIATLPNGKVFTVYFAPEIELSNKQYNHAFANLPGLPVQYELESGKLKFKYVLKSIDYAPIPFTRFEVPKTGYRLMTYEENQQLKKGVR